MMLVKENNMGRSISKSFFGPEVGKIQIEYHNGTAVVTGYVVKQTGTSTYTVSSNGVAMFTVKLAQTTGLASALTAGYATIHAVDKSAVTTYIKKVESNLVSTTDGKLVNWINHSDPLSVTLATIAAI
jgi:hypothetical protein